MRPAVLRHAPDTECFTEERCHITELSNSAADEQLSVALARVEPGVTTRWHRLRSTTERYVVVSGEGLVELGGMPPQSLAPNDVALIPPGCPQRITNTGDADLVFLALCTPRFQATAYEDAEPGPD